jgi:hypothetical protein
MAMEPGETKPRGEAPLHFAPYEQRLEFASYDARVKKLAAAFSHGDFKFDPAEVDLIADNYALTPEDITEGACVLSRLHIAEVVYE